MFYQLNPEKFKSDIKKFRITLIILTVFHLGFFGILFGGFFFIVKNGITDGGVIALWFLALFLSGLILSIFQIILSYRMKKYERKYMPVTSEKNKDNFRMMFFTGIIGLWLWLPNDKEVQKIIEKTTHNNV